MTEQTIFSLSEAAKITGKSKGTLSKALSSGRLSYRSKENGQYQIDAAELFRVFGETPSPTPKNERLETLKETPETAELRAQVETMRELLDDRAATIDDLRHRLDEERSERREKDRQLTALLSHQRQSVEKAPEEPPQRGFRFLGFKIHRAG